MRYKLLQRGLYMQAQRTEKEKMLAGELYLADAALQAEQVLVQQRVMEYNQSNPADAELRSSLLARIVGSVGERVVLRPPFQVDYGSNISIGSRTFINFNAVFLDCNKITIGEDCQIAPGVQFYTATHPLDAKTRKSGLESAQPITIGNNVWLGGNAIICPGVTIGDNTVVGAGSVVTKNLPANVLAVGNPAKVIRNLE
ncbi:sugar O-acetyltransferase [Bdellovibrio sp. HCB274]|uniref:sugar O-acetyltransferase n=1 Tax=Bdellovibrio sp. HCB274 TaxID=3394361 RepID=UPI0039B3D257